MKARKSFIERIVENWPAKILSLGAAIILFLFNQMSGLENRYFSVPLTVESGSRLMPSNDYPRMVRIDLRGEKKAIQAILERDIEAYLDLSGETAEGEKLVAVKTRARGTAIMVDPLEINVEPANVNLSLERVERKVVPIEPEFKGSLEPGYERVAQQISPPSVEIAGPRSLITRIQTIRTEAIDLTGDKDDIVIRASLVKRVPQLEFLSSTSAEVRVTIKQAVALKTFEAVPIMARGLRTDLVLAEELPSGSLRIQGSKTATDAFTMTPDVFAVDLSSVQGEGVFILPVIVNTPPEFIIVGQEPAEVTVRITAKRGGPR